jgi:hypothetical protein
VTTKKESETEELEELRSFIAYLENTFPSLLQSLRERHRAGEADTTKKGTDHYGT